TPPAAPAIAAVARNLRRLSFAEVFSVGIIVSPISRKIFLPVPVFFPAGAALSPRYHRSGRSQSRLHPIKIIAYVRDLGSAHRCKAGINPGGALEPHRNGGLNIFVNGVSDRSDGERPDIWWPVSNSQALCLRAQSLRVRPSSLI
ncbi:MAG: hypothetical protein WBD33_11205, partial [Xanthobacteraceae bacterium]